jgi:hypothetical protein
MRHIGTAKTVCTWFACGGLVHLLKIGGTCGLASLCNAGGHLGNGGIQGHMNWIKVEIQLVTLLQTEW